MSVVSRMVSRGGSQIGSRSHFIPASHLIVVNGAPAIRPCASSYSINVSNVSDTLVRRKPRVITDITLMVNLVGIANRLELTGAL
jgi:hypothetical protein